MKLENIYILVQDTDRAIRFYTEVLGFSLYRKQARYTILKLGDIWFGLLNEKYIEKPIRGNNCVPVFKVNNIQEKFNELLEKGVKLETDILDLADVRYFQFCDTENNILEIYEEK